MSSGYSSCKSTLVDVIYYSGNPDRLSRWTFCYMSVVAPTRPLPTVKGFPWVERTT